MLLKHGADPDLRGEPHPFSTSPLSPETVAREANRADILELIQEARREKARRQSLLEVPSHGLYDPFDIMIN